MLEHLTEAEKGYLAGILDGEGCIYILPRKRGKYYQSDLRVTISTTNINLISWLKIKIPMKSCTLNPQKMKSGNAIFNFIVSGVLQSQIFLTEILPYLIVKKEQAELILTSNFSFLGYIKRMEVKEKLSQIRKNSFTEFTKT